MVATGFWTGIAVGRFLLAFLTPKLGEKLAVIVSICTFFCEGAGSAITSFKSIPVDFAQTI
jgi:hypothetical protein